MAQAKSWRSWGDCFQLPLVHVTWIHIMFHWTCREDPGSKWVNSPRFRSDSGVLGAGGGAARVARLMKTAILRNFNVENAAEALDYIVFFFNEVPIFQRKPIASINHRTCKLSRSWNPCASFLRLEQDEEEYEGILYGYGFSYASLNNMGSGMQGQPVSIWGLKRFMCPRVVSEFSASSNHF